jgi:hypothetical protein
MPFGFLSAKDSQCIWLSNLFTVSTPGDGYFRNESIYRGHTWWWLFQKRVYLLWAHLVMVIPETSLFTVSTLGDGYYRNESIYCEHTWWWLFQKRVATSFWISNVCWVFFANQIVIFVYRFFLFVSPDVLLWSRGHTLTLYTDH